jgi:hypothetical protein
LFDPNLLYGLPDPTTDHCAGAPSWQGSDWAGPLGAASHSPRFLDDWLATGRDAPPADGGLSAASGLRASGVLSPDAHPRPEPTEFVYTHIGLGDPTVGAETQGDASPGTILADDTTGSPASTDPPSDVSGAAGASPTPDPVSSPQASDPDLSIPDLDWGSRAKGNERSTDYWPLIPRMLQLDLDRNKEIAQQSSAGDSGQGEQNLGQRLLQSTMDVVPGAYYTRLAKDQFHSGNYGAATAYATAALADAGLTVFGLSYLRSLIQRGAAPLTTNAAAALARSSPELSEDISALKLRLNDIHGAMDQFARRRRTSAILRTEGGDIVGSGGRDLSRAQEALLMPGEVGAKLPDAHAEVTVLSAALKAALRPRILVTSRRMCGSCVGTVQAMGGRITSPTTAIFDAER